MALLQLESNKEDLEKAARFLRALTEAELSRVIAHPRALEGRLKDYSIHHNNTADSRIAVQLAEEELERRREAPSRRRSTIAICISIVAVLVAIVSATKGLWWGVDKL
jgi:hypothetical protein